MPELKEDVLQEFSKEKALYFCNTILTKEWPYSIHAYYFIKTCLEWRDKDPSIDVNLLYCRNYLESGIFIGLLKSGSRTITMTAYSLKENDDFLGEILLETRQIPWDLLPLLQGLLPRHYPILDQAIRKHGFKTKIYVHSSFHVMNQPFNTYNNNIQCPPNVYISNLDTEDIHYIYDIWPIKDIYTKAELENSVNLNFGYGVYSKSDDTLLAWAMQTHYGGIGMLQTKDHVQRKGYGRLICKFLSEKLAEMNVQPYAFVKDDNMKSKQLFWSLGYTQISRIIYANVCKS